MPQKGGESTEYHKKHKSFSEKPLNDLLDFSPIIIFFWFSASGNFDFNASY